MKNFCFYFPLNLLLFVGKLHGLITFTYRTVPISYKTSTFLSAYSSAYTVVIVIVLQVLVIQSLSWLQYYQLISKTILIVVFTTETLITAYRVTAVYILQFYYRKQFRKLLTDATKIHRTLVEFMNGVLIFDKSFYRFYGSKVVGVLFQIIVIFFLISQFKRLIIFYSDVLTLSMVLYMHCTAIITSSIFYVGMMIILCFYQNLNRKAFQIFNSIKALEETDLRIKFKHELYGRLTDEIDQVVYIYEKISRFSKRVNRIFSSQLLISVVNAFYMILVQVGGFKDVFLNAVTKKHFTFSFSTSTTM